MRAVSAIADLAEDRVVEGVYAVIRKEKLRTRGGAPYLALQLADASGRIDARVWNDVELLDTRFGEGDAVRVLGRVERFRNRLQLEVRTLEPAELAAALVHDVGRTHELGPPPAFRPTEEGRLLGHVHLGLRVLEDAGAPAELLHAVAVHHDPRGSRTAEAAVLYHANQLDAVAATRPIPE